MAEITNYGELKTEVENWANRKNLTAEVPSFITSGLSRIADDIRHPGMDSLATGTVSTQAITKPVRQCEVKALKVGDVLCTHRPLNVILGYTGTGQPLHYTDYGDDILLGPTPDGSYAYSLYYCSSFATFASDVATNDLLDKYPMLYLSAALVYLFLYAKDTEEQAKWENEYLTQVASARKFLDRLKYPPGQLQIITTA